MSCSTPILQIFESHQTSYIAIEPNESLENIFTRRLHKIPKTEQTEKFIIETDKILHEKLQPETTLAEVLVLVYCGAKTVIELCELRQIEVFDQTNLPREFPHGNGEAQEKLYKCSRKLFTKLLFKNPQPRKGAPPSMEAVETYWSSLWEPESTFDGAAASEFIEIEEKKKFPRMREVAITLSDFKRVLKKKQSWATPGIDGIQNFWYKNFTSVHGVLVEKINRLLHGAEDLPRFLTCGITELFPKTDKINKVKKYRPITYLPAIYNIITRAIYHKIYQHYCENGVLADEQCGGRPGYYGTKKALLIDSVVLAQKPIWGLYIDYKKAFDMVAHPWLLKMLQVYGVASNVLGFLEKCMKTWQTRLFLSYERNSISRGIRFKRGIFQGDSLSVLFYWTSINALSSALKQAPLGVKFSCERTISHLLFMDDLKIYSSVQEERDEILKIVKNFTEAVSMEINDRKSKSFSVPLQNHCDPDSTKTDFHHSYLGYLQTPTIIHKNVVYHKVRKYEDKLKIFESIHLNPQDREFLKNIIIPKPIFMSFGVIKWYSFKRNLLEVKCNRKKLPNVVRWAANGKEDIYTIMMNEIYKLRCSFFESNDTLSKIIIENDVEVTPLNLGNKNHWEAIKLTVKNKKQKRH